MSFHFLSTGLRARYFLLWSVTFGAECHVMYCFGTMEQSLPVRIVVGENDIQKLFHERPGTVDEQYLFPDFNHAF